MSHSQTRGQPEYAIHAEGLVKRFGKTVALDGVNLSVRAGTVLGLLGPNGAGKTTVVRALATLIRPDAGHAVVGGFDVVRDAQKVRELIGLTGQYAAVDEEMTGIENLILIGRLLDLSRATARRRANELLERFELTDAGGRATKTYSGGMRRRLDLAASLVGNPRVLYLDEPTTGLDPHSQGEVWNIVRSLVADGVTVLLTTQYMDEADRLASEIVVIDHGRVIADGTPDELKTAVGGQILEARAADTTKTETLAAMMQGLVGTEPAREGDGTLLTVPVADPAMLPALVRRLDEVDIVASELALRRPSLGEVFLALTGHGTDDKEEVAA
jgi:oleandomycin transport system ATP-binding protein